MCKEIPDIFAAIACLCFHNEARRPQRADVPQMVCIMRLLCQILIYEVGDVLNGDVSAFWLVDVFIYEVGDFI